MHYNNTTNPTNPSYSPLYDSPVYALIIDDRSREPIVHIREGIKNAWEDLQQAKKLGYQALVVVEARTADDIKKVADLASRVVEKYRAMASSHDQPGNQADKQQPSSGQALRFPIRCNASQLEKLLSTHNKKGRT
ncbi:hypothetical protein D6783_01600 [Candidatus Woesearchaeota archaeon]|nr:MAG: hypothetical protein D6783_01600 [Candidatus Woesearchaeota archaeon]